jgi:hypothetical protein
MSEGEAREEAGREQSAQIREADIAAFADKFEEWGASLPVKERAMLHLLLARAEGSVEELHGGEDLTLPGVMDTTLSVLRPLFRQVDTARVRGWVEAGDPWIQSAF